MKVYSTEINMREISLTFLAGAILGILCVHGEVIKENESSPNGWKIVAEPVEEPQLKVDGNARSWSTEWAAKSMGRDQKLGSVPDFMQALRSENHGPDFEKYAAFDNSNEKADESDYHFKTPHDSNDFLSHHQNHKTRPITNGKDWSIPHVQTFGMQVNEANKRTTEAEKIQALKAQVKSTKKPKAVPRKQLKVSVKPKTQGKNSKATTKKAINMIKMLKKPLGSPNQIQPSKGEKMLASLKSKKKTKKKPGSTDQVQDSVYERDSPRQNNPDKTNDETSTAQDNGLHSTLPLENIVKGLVSGAQGILQVNNSSSAEPIKGTWALSYKVNSTQKDKNSNDKKYTQANDVQLNFNNAKNNQEDWALFFHRGRSDVNKDKTENPQKKVSTKKQSLKKSPPGRFNDVVSRRDRREKIKHKKKIALVPTTKGWSMVKLSKSDTKPTTNTKKPKSKQNFTPKSKQKFTPKYKPKFTPKSTPKSKPKAKPKAKPKSVHKKKSKNVKVGPHSKAILPTDEGWSVFNVTKPAKSSKKSRKKSKTPKIVVKPVWVADNKKPTAAKIVPSRDGWMEALQPSKSKPQVLKKKFFKKFEPAKVVTLPTTNANAKAKANAKFKAKSKVKSLKIGGTKTDVNKKLLKESNVEDDNPSLLEDAKDEIQRNLKKEGVVNATGQQDTHMQIKKLNNTRKGSEEVSVEEGKNKIAGVMEAIRKAGLDSPQNHKKVIPPKPKHLSDQTDELSGRSSGHGPVISGADGKEDNTTASEANRQASIHESLQTAMSGIVNVFTKDLDARGASEEKDGKAQRDTPKEPEDKNSTNAAWTPWSQWGSCSVSCGRGWISRRRFCLTVTRKCDGRAIEMKFCHMKPCPVEILRASEKNQAALNPQGEWSPWGPCSVTCGEGWMVRRKICYGRHLDKCSGPQVDIKRCRKHRRCISPLRRKMHNMRVKPAGEQVEWSAWGACSASCGQGWKIRTRECNINNLSKCTGGRTDVKKCKAAKPCPGSKGSKTKIIKVQLGKPRTQSHTIYLESRDNRESKGKSKPSDKDSKPNKKKVKVKLKMPAKLKSKAKSTKKRRKKLPGKKKQPPKRGGTKTHGRDSKKKKQPPNKAKTKQTKAKSMKQLQSDAKKKNNTPVKPPADKNGSKDKAQQKDGKPEKKSWFKKLKDQFSKKKTKGPEPKSIATPTGKPTVKPRHKALPPMAKKASSKGKQRGKNKARANQKSKKVSKNTKKTSNKKTKTAEQQKGKTPTKNSKKDEKPSKLKSFFNKLSKKHGQKPTTAPKGKQNPKSKGNKSQSKGKKEQINKTKSTIKSKKGSKKPQKSSSSKKTKTKKQQQQKTKGKTSSKKENKLKKFYNKLKIKQSPKPTTAPKGKKNPKSKGNKSQSKGKTEQNNKTKSTIKSKSGSKKPQKSSSNKKAKTETPQQQKNKGKTSNKKESKFKKFFSKFKVKHDKKPTSASKGKQEPKSKGKKAQPGKNAQMKDKKTTKTSKNSQPKNKGNPPAIKTSENSKKSNKFKNFFDKLGKKHGKKPISAPKGKQNVKSKGTKTPAKGKTTQKKKNKATQKSKKLTKKPKTLLSGKKTKKSKKSQQVKKRRKSLRKKNPKKGKKPDKFRDFFKKFKGKHGHKSSSAPKGKKKLKSKESKTTKKTGEKKQPTSKSKPKTGLKKPQKSLGKTKSKGKTSEKKTSEKSKKANRVKSFFDKFKVKHGHKPTTAPKGKPNLKSRKLKPQPRGHAEQKNKQKPTAQSKKGTKKPQSSSSKSKSKEKSSEKKTSDKDKKPSRLKSFFSKLSRKHGQKPTTAPKGKEQPKSKGTKTPPEKKKEGKKKKSSKSKSVKKSKKGLNKTQKPSKNMKKTSARSRKGKQRGKSPKRKNASKGKKPPKGKKPHKQRKSSKNKKRKSSSKRMKTGKKSQRKRVSSKKKKKKPSGRRNSSKKKNRKQSSKRKKTHLKGKTSSKKSSRKRGQKTSKSSKRKQKLKQKLKQKGKGNKGKQAGKKKNQKENTKKGSKKPTKNSNQKSKEKKTAAKKTPKKKKPSRISLFFKKMTKKHKQKTSPKAKDKPKPNKPLPAGKQKGKLKDKTKSKDSEKSKSSKAKGVKQKNRKKAGIKNKFQPFSKKSKKKTVSDKKKNGKTTAKKTPKKKKPSKFVNFFKKLGKKNKKENNKAKKEKQKEKGNKGKQKGKPGKPGKGKKEKQKPKSKNPAKGKKSNRKPSKKTKGSKKTTPGKSKGGKPGATKKGKSLGKSKKKLKSTHKGMQKSKSRKSKLTGKSKKKSTKKTKDGIRGSKNQKPGRSKSAKRKGRKGSKTTSRKKTNGKNKTGKSTKGSKKLSDKKKKGKTPSKKTAKHKKPNKFNDFFKKLGRKHKHKQKNTSAHKGQKSKGKNKKETSKGKKPEGKGKDTKKTKDGKSVPPASKFETKKGKKPEGKGKDKKKTKGGKPVSPASKFGTKKEWTMWSKWGMCSKTCGTGVQSRTRKCVIQRSKGKPRKVSGCPGGPVESKKCAVYPCDPFDSDGILVPEGYQVKLKCPYKNSTKVSQIHWITPRGKQIMDDTLNLRYLVKGNILYIKHSRREDMGVYRCLVADKKGKIIETLTAQLIVQTCKDNFCQNGGRCLELAASKKQPYPKVVCKCTEGYTGRFCTTSKKDKNADHHTPLFMKDRKLLVIFVILIFCMVVAMCWLLLCICGILRKKQDSEKKKNDDKDNPENKPLLSDTDYEYAEPIYEEITYSGTGPEGGSRKKPAAGNDYVTPEEQRRLDKDRKPRSKPKALFREIREAVDMENCDPLCQKTHEHPPSKDELAVAERRSRTHDKPQPARGPIEGASRGSLPPVPTPAPALAPPPTPPPAPAAATPDVRGEDEDLYLTPVPAQTVADGYLHSATDERSYKYPYYSEPTTKAQSLQGGNYERLSSTYNPQLYQPHEGPQTVSFKEPDGSNIYTSTPVASPNETSQQDSQLEKSRGSQILDGGDQPGVDGLTGAEAPVVYRTSAQVQPVHRPQYQPPRPIQGQSLPLHHYQSPPNQVQRGTPGQIQMQPSPQSRFPSSSSMQPSLHTRFQPPSTFQRAPSPLSHAGRVSPPIRAKIVDLEVALGFRGQDGSPKLVTHPTPPTRPTQPMVHPIRGTDSIGDSFTGLGNVRPPPPPPPPEPVIMPTGSGPNTAMASQAASHQSAVILPAKSEPSAAASLPAGGHQSAVITPTKSEPGAGLSSPAATQPSVVILPPGAVPSAAQSSPVPSRQSVVILPSGSEPNAALGTPSPSHQSAKISITGSKADGTSVTPQSTPNTTNQQTLSSQNFGDSFTGLSKNNANSNALGIPFFEVPMVSPISRVPPPPPQPLISANASPTMNTGPDPINDLAADLVRKMMSESLARKITDKSMEKTLNQIMEAKVDMDVETPINSRISIAPQEEPPVDGSHHGSHHGSQESIGDAVDLSKAEDEMSTIVIPVSDESEILEEIISDVLDAASLDSASRIAAVNEAANGDLRQETEQQGNEISYLEGQESGDDAELSSDEVTEDEESRAVTSSDEAG